jgi:uncharacterized protein (UPF0332 family)
MAAFHAAEAVIIARTGRPARTHRGVRTELSRLARTEPRIPREHLTFLAKGYELKSIADYGIGPDEPAISAEDAGEAIDTAARIVDSVAAMLQG